MKNILERLHHITTHSGLFSTPLLAAALFLSIGCGQEALGAGPFIRDNGVIKVEINGNSWAGGTAVPVITRLWIGGVLWMPTDNPGAAFQLSTRDASGDQWNPTQGGDCAGNTSTWNAYSATYSMGGAAGTKGILWNVSAIDYGEYSGSCHHTAGNPVASNVQFQMGISLGDVTNVPAQAMGMDMSMRRMNTSVPSLRKDLSEWPVAFPYSSLARYIYFYSAGTWHTWLYNGSYDIYNFPILSSLNPVECVAAATSPNWLDGTSGTAMALCNKIGVGTQANVGFRNGSLTLISLIGSGTSASITDTNWHTQTGVLLVGNMNTVNAARSAVNSKYSWPRL